MKSRRITRLIAGMGAMLLGISSVSFQTSETVAQTIREIAVPGMRGIASVGYRGNELTIEYNPRTCARLGPDLCSFFRAHEYGHVALRHIERGTPVRQAEYEADVWAARNSTPAARAAAVQYFRAGNGGSARHGSAQSRAARVASGGTTSRARVTVRQDGSRVVNRGYSATVQRPFNTGRTRPLFPLFFGRGR